MNTQEGLVLEAALRGDAARVKLLLDYFLSGEKRELKEALNLILEDLEERK